MDELVYELSLQSEIEKSKISWKSRPGCAQRTDECVRPYVLISCGHWGGVLYQLRYTYCDRGWGVFY